MGPLVIAVPGGTLGVTPIAGARARARRRTPAPLPGRPRELGRIG